MKKALFALCVSSILFASCGNSAVNGTEADSVAVDSVAVDSVVVDTMVVDSVAVVDCDMVSDTL